MDIETLAYVFLGLALWAFVKHFAIGWNRAARRHETIGDIKDAYPVTITAPGKIPACGLFVVKPSEWTDLEYLAQAIKHNNGKGVILCIAAMDLEPDMLSQVRRYTPEGQEPWSLKIPPELQNS